MHRVLVSPEQHPTNLPSEANTTMTDKFAIPGVPVFNLTARDKEILAQADEDYHLQSWDDLKTIIGTSAF